MNLEVDKYVKTKENKRTNGKNITGTKLPKKKEERNNEQKK